MKLSELLTSGAISERGQPRFQIDSTESRRRQEAQCCSEDEQRRLESLPPKYILHTVHGTFASDAPWKDPDSAFGEALRRGLGWRARIEPLRWTGHNSVADRLQAARDLSRQIEEQLDKFGDAEHVVVAHSHGGNIAFTALASPELAQRLLGVVTLATPFLAARPRPGRKLMDLGECLFAGLFAGWAVLFVGLYKGTGWAMWPWAIAAAAATCGVLLLGSFLNDRMQQHARRICEAMPPTALQSKQVAIVRVQGDEATAAIAGARLAGTLADLVWRVSTNRIFDWLNRVLTFWDYGSLRSFSAELERGVFKGDHTPASVSSGADVSSGANLSKTAWQAVFQVLPILLFQMFRQGDRNTQLVAMAFIGIYGMPAAFAVATVVLGIPFAILSSLSLLPCGRTVPLAGPYLDLAAEASPPGSWTVTSLQGSVTGTGLYHSEAHEDPAVPIFITNWILEHSHQVTG